MLNNSKIRQNYHCEPCRTFCLLYTVGQLVTTLQPSHAPGKLQDRTGLPCVVRASQALPPALPQTQKGGKPKRASHSRPRPWPRPRPSAYYNLFSLQQQP